MAVAAAREASGEVAQYAVDVEDVVYVQHDDGPLQARLYKPRGAGPFPMVAEIHGGAWCNGDRASNHAQNEALARNGIVVVALDFRMPPRAAYPNALADIHYAVRWLKAKAGELHGRADRVGLIGNSSGGHLAMLLAMRPHDPRYAAIALPGDATVSCVVMCWPVIDPLGRYRHARDQQAAGATRPEMMDKVIPLHIQFWGDEAAMAEGNPVMALERGERAELPPVLCLQGTIDQMHPRPHLDRFVAQYRKRGGDLELALYEGEGEGFFARNSQSPNTAAGIARIIDFVQTRLG